LIEAAVVVGTALFSLVLVVAVRRLTIRLHLFDRPNDRSSHTVPTPRCGGAGIVVAVIAGTAVLVRVTSAPSHSLVKLLAAAVLIAAVSLIDDLRTLSAAVRFPVHLIASAIVVMTIGYWQDAAAGHLLVHFGIAGALLTCLWIAGVTNVYNFMDGIDGIAGVQALTAGTAWAIIGLNAGALPAAIMGAVIAAASLGFLFHNWPPARIFMGDVGSAFLGFLFAATPLLVPLRDSLARAILVLWPFLFDSTFTLLRRLRRRENIFAAHRSHLYQRLIISGRSHRFVTTLYGLLAVWGALAAITMSRWVLLPLALMPPALWLFVVRQERA